MGSGQSSQYCNQVNSYDEAQLYYPAAISFTQDAIDLLSGAEPPKKYVYLLQ